MHDPPIRCQKWLYYTCCACNLQQMLPQTSRPRLTKYNNYRISKLSVVKICLLPCPTPASNNTSWVLLLVTHWSRIMTKLNRAFNVQSPAGIFPGKPQTPKVVTMSTEVNRLNSRIFNTHAWHSARFRYTKYSSGPFRFCQRDIAW